MRSFSVCPVGVRRVWNEVFLGVSCRRAESVE